MHIWNIEVLSCFYLHYIYIYIHMRCLSGHSSTLPRYPAIPLETLLSCPYGAILRPWKSWDKPEFVSVDLANFPSGKSTTRTWGICSCFGLLPLKQIQQSLLRPPGVQQAMQSIYSQKTSEVPIKVWCFFWIYERRKFRSETSDNKKLRHGESQKREDKR